FSILYRIALDVIPVQASAVPCERAFSSSKETDTNRRSGLGLEFMEVLQMYKCGVTNREVCRRKRRIIAGQRFAWCGAPRVIFCYLSYCTICNDTDSYVFVPRRII
ncbi:hypothetical protein BJ912DRAFT_866959, partial [Pholiota molesta]